MRYYKLIDNGYLVAIGKGKGNTEITEAEYNTILDLIRNKPTAESGYDYRLREDLTWELYELPIVEPTEETPTPKRLEDMTKEELIEFITQGGSY